MYKTLLFDLDGTLTDSSEGITKCAQLALNHFDKTGYSLADLRVFIGPPLNETFARFGLHDEQIEEAIKVFRSRYNTVGKFENKPYPHIKKTLKDLKKAGAKLAVELQPLCNFFPAEEYHQKYLDKNPGGYCHIPSRFFHLG